MKRFAMVVVMFAGASILAGTSLTGLAGEKKDKSQGADGVWIVVAMQHGDMKLPPEAIEKLNMKLTIKGENYTVTMGDKVADKGTSKVDLTKKPNTVDIKSEEGPNKGKTILAIVEIEGDTMKACYDLEGKIRPSEFSTKEGPTIVLIQYKRATK